MGRHHKPERGGLARAALVGGALAVVEATHPGLAVADPLDAVEQCESGGDPTTHNPSSSAAGLFQILSSTWRAFGGNRYAPTADQASPTEQRAVAERIYATEGLAPWAPSQACWAGRIDHTHTDTDTDITAASYPVEHPTAPRHTPSTGYLVRRGDTLSAIADRYGLTWQQLWNQNHQLIENPNLIRPGLRLSLAGIASGALGSTPTPAVSPHHPH